MPVMGRYAIYTKYDCVNTGCIHVHLVLLKWSSLLTLICIYLINKCIMGDPVFSCGPSTMCKLRSGPSCSNTG